MSQLKEDEYWKRCIKYKNSKAKENPRLNFDDGIKLNRAKKTSFGWDGFYKSEKGKAKVFEKTKVKWKEENERKWRECEKEAELTLVVWRESTSREEEVVKRKTERTRKNFHGFLIIIFSLLWKSNAQD